MAAVSHLPSSLTARVLLPSLLGLLAVAGCVGPIKTGEGDLLTRPRDGKLEVRVFQGGYGVDFYNKAAEEYMASHPGVEIDLKGDPRIWEQLRPRFIGGDPPGLVFPGWGFDHYAHIQEKQVVPLNDVLLTTPYGEEGGTWRDTFLPDTLKLGEYDGQVYLLPLYLSLYGWWYNVDLFEANGWTPPRTYDEFLALSEKIKAKGIAPLTYQGKYPYYSISGFLLPWALSEGGMEVITNLEELKPGAWNHPAFLSAAKRVAEVREKGYFQERAAGLSHTEAQLEFLNGKAAMIPCGTWLESEMKKQMPAGFRMAFILPPVIPGGKGDPTSVQVGVEPWLIPTRGTNSALAIDFFKYMTSKKKAREFVLTKGTLTAIKGSDDDPLPLTLRSAAQALRGARVTWTTRYSQWYKAMDTEVQKSYSALAKGEITPEKFLEEAEAAAEKVRKDPNIPKRKP